MRGTPKVMRLVAAVALALAAVVLLLGVSGPAQAQSRQETLIIARNIDDYVTNDVHRTYEYTSQILDTAAYDTLVTVDAPDFTKIQPRLATSWTVSPDGTTYTFKLRPGVKFTSGNPLTANDVRFSLRRLKNLKDNPSFFTDPIKDIQAVDDLTVRIVLAAPDASFLAALAAVPCGVADSKVVMAKGGTDADDAKDKDKATEHLNNQSEGSGPYKLVSFTKNVEAVLERNASYWGKKPYFAKVIFKHVPSGTTQREMVERGDADVAHDIDADIVAKITQGPKIKIVEGLSMNQVYVGVTNSAEQSKELADKRVRQAVAYAIDYDGIIKGIVRGAAERPLDHDPPRDPRRRQDPGAQARRRQGQAAPDRGRVSERDRPQADVLDRSASRRALRAARREAPGRPGPGRDQGHPGREGALGRHRRVPGRKDPADAGLVVPGLPRPAIRMRTPSTARGRCRSA